VTPDVIYIWINGAFFTIGNYTLQPEQMPALPLWNPDCDKHI
jgi:hypothetical protein